MSNFRFKKLYFTRTILVQILCWGAMLPISTAERASGDQHGKWNWGESIDPPARVIDRNKDKTAQYGLTKLPAESFDDDNEGKEAKVAQPNQKAQHQQSMNKSEKK